MIAYRYKKDILTVSELKIFRYILFSYILAHSKHWCRNEKLNTGVPCKHKPKFHFYQCSITLTLHEVLSQSSARCPGTKRHTLPGEERAKKSVLQNQRPTTEIFWQQLSCEGIICLFWNASPAVEQAQELCVLRWPKIPLSPGISALVLFQWHHLFQQKYKDRQYLCVQMLQSTHWLFSLAQELQNCFVCPPNSEKFSRASLLVFGERVPSEGTVTGHNLSTLHGILRDSNISTFISVPKSKHKSQDHRIS